MKYVLGFVCVLALGLMGCSSEPDNPLDPFGTGGGGGDGESAITPGLWIGGSPENNANGRPFGTGWAICFHVNEDGTALTPSPDCTVDGSDDGEKAWSLEVGWKDDVGSTSLNGDVGECNGSFAEDRESEGFTNTYAIEENSFEVPQSITGTFDGDTATGTAQWVFHPGMGPGAECYLVGGWTASPVVTECTGIEEGFVKCTGDGVVGLCYREQCYPTDCEGLEDGTTCVNTAMFGAWLNACEAGECVYPEDCTGIADGVLCVDGDCYGETCYKSCEELEDGSNCLYYGDVYQPNVPPTIGVCEGVECVAP